VLLPVGIMSSLKCTTTLAFSGTALLLLVGNTEET